MGFCIKDIFKETTVGSLKLCFNATNIIEKICWLLMGILGTIFMSVVIVRQIESWSLNPIISSRNLVDLSKVNFPAITFCHQGNTRMEVVERLIQAADENSLKMRQLRSAVLKNAMEYLIQNVANFILEPRNYEQYADAISDKYYKKCSQYSTEYHCIGNDCLCRHYNIAFGYAKAHNLTMEEIYEKIYHDLVSEAEINTGLTKIQDSMAKSIDTGLLGQQWTFDSTASGEEDQCHTILVTGESPSTAGIYEISDKKTVLAPSNTVWKKPGYDRFIFNSGSIAGWRVGKEESLETGNCYYKGFKQTLPISDEYWKKCGSGSTKVTVKCIPSQVELETKVSNLAGIWSSTKWSLPSQGSTGYIKKAGTNMVLGVVNVTEVIEEKLDNSTEQIWQIESSCCEKYYIIRHVSSGKVLTAVSTSNAAVKLTIKDLFLERNSNQWLFLEKIDALFSIATKSQLTMPINFDRSMMELIDLGASWSQENSDEIFNFFSLPNNELNLMAISHLYTMNDFGQLGQSELFSYQQSNNLPGKKDEKKVVYLGGVQKGFKSCFKQMSYGYYGNEKQGIWKFDSVKLRNKADNWKSIDFNLPHKNSEGQIRNHKTNKVLSVVNDATSHGAEVIEEIFENSTGQIWKIGEPDNYGYFVITNPASGKLLTAKSKDNLVIEDPNENEHVKDIPLPCSNVTQEHPCRSYCQWHKAFFQWSQISKKEFLTIMKLSQPERQLVSPPFSEAELSLSRKLFDIKSDLSMLDNKKTQNIASMPLIIFCKNKLDQEWLGNDIGLGPNFCSDFYSTPTDQGICLTKNLNFDTLIRFSDAFTQSFETNKQNTSNLIQGGRLNAKATFIISTNSEADVTSKTFSRSMKIGRQQEMEEVYFQIHSTNELPQILNDPHQRTEMDSLSLKAGNEYFIELTPFGQNVTNQFRKLDYQDRNCFLSKELPAKGSQLKVYSKQNCRYECKINIAIENCGCIPWDFPLNIIDSDVMECDIFGRTCFMNSIEQSTANEINQCPQCQDECEFMEFHKTRITEKAIKYGEGWFKFSSDGCIPDYFCDYLLDANDTIESLTWYEKLRDVRDGIEGNAKKETKKSQKYLKDHLEDHIVVHLNFASSKVEMNILDARYSFYDKFSKLGGTLGICGQITGASFLTLVHLVVLIMKAIFKLCSNYLH